MGLKRVILEGGALGPRPEEAKLKSWELALPSGWKECHPMSAAIYPSIIHHAQHHLPMRTLGTY